jgi:ABC-type transport system substrate-binding protein
VTGRWGRVAGAALPVLLIVSVACGGDGEEADNSETSSAETTTTTQAPEPGGKLVYGLTAETTSWNPAEGQWSQASWAVGGAVFDTLAYWDAEYRPQPYLAKSFTPDETFSEWTITLREGITFHNGEPLDAEAVKLNFETYLASPLVGPAMRAIQEVSVVDPLTVQIDLIGPWAEFPQGLAAAPGVMMAPEMINDPEGGANPIGTGPFVFEEWVPDDRVVLTANEDYFLGRPYVDELEFKVIVDNQARRNALDSGDLDAAQVSSPADLQELEQRSDVKVHIASAGEEQETFVLLNQLKPPFDNIRAREAVIAGVDREEIAEALFDGYLEVADGMFPPDSPWYVDTDYPEHDQERAIAAKEAYEAETGQPLTFELGGPPTDASLEIRQAIAEQLEAIDIDVEITSLEQTQYIASTVSGSYQASMWIFHGSPHPDSEYPFLHGSFAAPEGELGLNFARHRNGEMDALLNRARAQSDPATQKELYDEIQRLHAEGLVYLWLWHLKQGVVTRPAVHGVTEWQFEDGTEGAPLQQLRHKWHQIWIDQQP